MTKKIKVSNLTDSQLAEWVARAQGWKQEKVDDYKSAHLVDSWVNRNENRTILGNEPILEIDNYRPDLNWSQCEKLVDKFIRNMDRYYNLSGKEIWSVSYRNSNYPITGDTLPIAICRAVVASVYGEYVDG